MQKTAAAYGYAKMVQRMQQWNACCIRLFWIKPKLN